MDKSDFAKRMADKLFKQLQGGTAPWQQPWDAGRILSPYNRGVNVMALIVTGRDDPRWMTYRQAQAHGWQVRAGKKERRFSIGFGRRPGRV